MLENAKLVATVVLIAALQGCAGTVLPRGSDVPGGQSATKHASYVLAVVAVNPVTKNCPRTKYQFCIAVSASNTGPYIEWSACNGSDCPPSQAIAPNNAFYTKKGLPLKPNRLVWNSSGGANPSYIYIDEKKKPYPSSHGHVRLVGQTQACYVSDPSDCSAWVTYGIMFL